MSSKISIKHMVAGGIEEKGSSNIGASHHPIVISNGEQKKHILLDMGARPSNMFDKSVENPLINIDIKNLDAVFISHVHQDHVGSLIRLVKAGYKWPIYMSEKSKKLARVIFDDMLKHEKEDVAEHNRKVRNLQEELAEAWFVVRVRMQAPETRHMKNPHDKISNRFFSIKNLFDERINELMWQFNVKRKKFEKTIRETLYNRKHDDVTTANVLRQVNWDNQFDEEDIVAEFVKLKKEISYSQENFSDLQYENAKEKLAQHNIKEKDDIKELDRHLAIMEFNDNDVMQALGQIKTLPMWSSQTIFDGLLDATLYSAGHIEGSTQVLLTISDKEHKKNLLFSGDLGRSKQPGLCGKPDIPTEEISYMMLEGTYAGRIHNDRMSETSKLIDDINHSKSMTLLPCFALQRFQEIICMLVEAAYRGELKLGRGEKIYCHSPLATALSKEYIADDPKWVYKGLTDNALLQWISEPEEVVELLERGGRRIVVCSGGMLEKGTVTQYIDQINEDKHAKIILTGFQVPGTNGHKILHGDFSKPVYLNNKTISSNNAQISTYVFSGHADHEELKNHFLSLNPSDDITLCMVHGWDQRQVLADDIAKSFKQQHADKKLTTKVPETNGEVIELDW